MNVDGLVAVERDDVPLLAATAAIAIASLAVILFDAEGNLLVVPLLVGGTLAFVWLTLQQVPRVDPRVTVSSGAMILGSVLVAFDIGVFFDFDGPLGAALFLFGAIGLRGSLEE